MESTQDNDNLEGEIVNCTDGGNQVTNVTINLYMFPFMWFPIFGLPQKK